MKKEPLKFIVAPHIVQDLGLNLYTNLPRVLVEFVANAYDADSPYADITMDKDAIDHARKIIRKEYELQKVEAEKTGVPVEPLETRVLSYEHKIIIEDRGHGMSRDEIGEKFLVAGRRRLLQEKELEGRSLNGRPLMGRKGLGKLAGFGVAKVIEVISKKEGDATATKITLDFDKLLEKRGTHEIDVPDETLEDGGRIDRCGTRIILSGLLYDPVKSRVQTIENELGEHFDLISPDEFQIRMNGRLLEPPERELAYAWPEPKSVPIDEFVTYQLDRYGGGKITFRYRMRFTAEGQALPAAKRGVRVYVNKRLAAAPSLLQANTNMHGFRMTDYLDGVVHADFIANEEADYIATDRQSLRWESPLLSTLNDFLSDEIKEACKNYQKKRDHDAPNKVREDDFTRLLIEKQDFSRSDEKFAYRIAALLQSSCKRGLDDPIYKDKLPILLQSIGHGTILAAITSLASEEQPDLHRVAWEMARLTKDELDNFYSYIKARLQAIEALKKIVVDADFKKKQNEKIIQRMFEKSPWIIDPTYTQFLTADQSMKSLFQRLAKHLQIGDYASSRHGKRRPDLVFLLGSKSLHKLVIVELKSANTPLNSKHLDQLEYYMQRAEDWLESQCHGNIRVLGQLVGSKDDPNSKSEGALVLKRRIENSGINSPWRVRDYLEILEETQAAHYELMNTYKYDTEYSKNTSNGSGDSLT